MVDVLSINRSIYKAKKYLNQNDFKAAKNQYLKILLKFPKNIRILNELKILINSQNIQPNDEIINYFNQGKFQEVISLCYTVLEKHPYSYSIYNILAITYQILRNYNCSIESFSKAIDINPYYADGYYNLGVAYTQNGDFEKALKNYNKALSLNPNNTVVHRSISLIKKYEHDDDHLNKMLTLLKSQGMQENQKTQLYFALAKAFEDIRDYKKSFDFYIKGNYLRKKEFKYNIKEDENLFKNIRKEFFKKNEVFTNNNLKTKNKFKPIFIVGLPRSGSSLLEKIISCHPKVHACGELDVIEKGIKIIQMDNIFKNNNSKLLRSFYFENILQLKIRKNIFIDKMPLNFRWIGYILSSFPEAKIIHISRSPVATCWSMFKQYFNSYGNQFAYDLDDLVKYYKMYDELMKFWNDLHPKKIYNLNYELLTESPAKQLTPLFRYLNLEYKNDFLQFYKNYGLIETASLSQVRKQLYTGSSLNYLNFKVFLNEFIKKLNNKI